MNRDVRSNVQLALAAFVCVAIFPLIVVALHLVQQDHYHPLSEAVSELALGDAGWLMTIAFCSLATGTLLVATVLRREGVQPRVAPVLLGVTGLFSFVSAFVHADPSGGASTTHGQIHQLAGIATFLLIIVSMFLLARGLRRDPRWSPLATPTRICALLATTSLVATGAGGDAYFGLGQRCLIGVSLAWMLTTSLYAYRLTARGPAGEGAA
jgi:Protein of unknown function (DUF998)